DLPALGADATGITVSGLSSGGAMAVQFHVAHSTVVKGAGIVAGAPYYCAQGSVRAAYSRCMTPAHGSPIPATASLIDEVRAQAKAGRIDPPEHLARARVWLF